MTLLSIKPRIAIGICTRQRNALLRRLLESIWAQPIPQNFNVEILIVDNNDEAAVTPDIIAFPDKFKVTLVHEPKPGLVHARNRVLDTATQIKADWVIGVDDDEYVAPDWLAQFIVGFETFEQGIIVGARRIVYSDETSPFVKRIKQDQLPAGEESKILSTANFAVSKQVFDPEYGHGLRFDPALNESGGEDAEFMLRAKYKHGVRAVKWPFAVAIEHFDGQRTKFRYQFKRRMLDQLSRYRIVRLHRLAGVRGSRLGNVRKLARLTMRFVVRGIFFFLQGIFLLLLNRRNARETIGLGLLNWARAFAIIPYLIGRRTVLYGANVNADRSA